MQKFTFEENVIYSVKKYEHTAKISLALEQAIFSNYIKYIG